MSCNDKDLQIIFNCCCGYRKDMCYFTQIGECPDRPNTLTNYFD